MRKAADGQPMEDPRQVAEAEPEIVCEDVTGFSGMAPATVQRAIPKVAAAPRSAPTVSADVMIPTSEFETGIASVVPGGGVRADEIERRDRRRDRDRDRDRYYEDDYDRDRDAKDRSRRYNDGGGTASTLRGGGIASTYDRAGGYDYDRRGGRERDADRDRDREDQRRGGRDDSRGRGRGGGERERDRERDRERGGRDRDY